MLEPEKLDWIKVYQAGNQGMNFIKPGKVRLMTTERKDIQVARLGNELFAYETHCPHNGFSLKDVVPSEDCIVTCPLHRYSYKLQTGAEMSGEGFRLEIYPIQLREDGMYVGFPKKRRLFGIF